MTAKHEIGPIRASSSCSTCVAYIYRTIHQTWVHDQADQLIYSRRPIDLHVLTIKRCWQSPRNDLRKSSYFVMCWHCTLSDVHLESGTSHHPSVTSAVVTNNICNKYSLQSRMLFTRLFVPYFTKTISLLMFWISKFTVLTQFLFRCTYNNHSRHVGHERRRHMLPTFFNFLRTSLITPNVQEGVRRTP